MGERKVPLDETNSHLTFPFPDNLEEEIGKWVRAKFIEAGLLPLEDTKPSELLLDKAIPNPNS